MREWKPKFKLGQYVYFHYQQDVRYGYIVAIHDNQNYQIKSGEKVFGIPEYYIAKTLRKMVLRVLGKDYVFAMALKDYLKYHYQGGEPNENSSH